MKTHVLTTVGYWGILALVAAGLPNSYAALLVVTNLSDSGPGTLRQAIADSASGDTITFAANGMITLAGSPLSITNSLSIAGPGPANLSVSGNNASRVFNVQAGATADISSLLIRDGRSDYGGGILNGGTLVLSNCVITANASTVGNAGSGGGIFNAGALALIACTISNNFCGNGGRGGNGLDGTFVAPDGGNGGPGGHGGDGGGIYNGGALTLTACTVNHNTTGNGGDGGAGGSAYRALPTLNPGNGGHGGLGGKGGAGAGVYNGSAATLALTNCTIYGNVPGKGGWGGAGGLAGWGLGGSGSPGSGGSGGDGGDGGGVYNKADSSGLALTACTVSTNWTGDGGLVGPTPGIPGPIGHAGRGGGLYSLSGVQTELRNTLVAQNRLGTGETGSPGWADLKGTNFLSHGYNLVGYNDGGFIISNQAATDIVPVTGFVTNALLASLGDYGGSTQTAALRPGSPATDAGDDSLTNTLATDQRGAPRRYGPHVDIGAFESEQGNVSSLNDNGVGSLREVLATGQSVVGFAPGLDGGTIALTSGQITLSNSVTIDASSLAHGLMISGNNSNRIFEVTTGAVASLASLTLLNGNAYFGGAVLVDADGALTVVNSIVASNSATYGGGLVNKGTLTLSNLVVVGNVATINSGGIENDYGTLTVLDSLISSNSASFGAGIGSFSSNSVTLITRSSLFGNHATNNSGGILNAFGSTIQINNATLSGNSASNNGGGIINNSGALAMNNSTLSGNSAGVGGGAFNFNSGTVAFNNCTLCGNSAGIAGGIHNDGTLALTNTIVAGNTATTFPDVHLNSGSFVGANNLTNGNPLLVPLGNYGGPTQTMPPLPGSPVIDAGNDSAASAFITDQRGFPRLIGAHVDIGAVEYLASPVVTTIADSGTGSLRDAVAFSTNGTTITFDPSLSGQTLLLSSGELLLNGNLVIDGSLLPASFRISGNNSSRIFEVSSGAVITLNTLTLVNGSAGSAGSGGAILVDAGGALTLANSLVSSNSATFGGGLVNYGTLTLSNLVVVGNVATNNSGGVENDGGTLTISDSQISSNSASLGGGVGSWFSSAVTLITGSSIFGNRATSDGGGILNDSSALNLNNSDLSGNSAAFGGGAFNMNGGTLAINSCTLSRNSVNNNGGGLENEGSTLTISGSLLSSNSAVNGGSIRNALGSTLQLNNTTLSGNSATNNGGGIANNSSGLTLNNTTLVGNSAGFGGAIYNVNTGTVTLVNATLSANAATSGGGGIFQNNSGGLCALTNTIVAGNTAAGVANNISGSFSGAYNLTTGDPLLAPLDKYGGPTLTMRPLPGSPAIDAGLDSVTNFLATDQRGYSRRYGAHVDIGAVEARLAIVSTLNDSGAGSLRDAFTVAPEWIGFATYLAGGTITLTNGQIDIADDVTVDASGLPGLVWISGNNSSRIFEVNSGATVTLNSLSLRNGYAGSGGWGGAILVDSGSTLTLNRLTVSGNSTSGAGGGICNFGVLSVNSSTISGNTGNFAGAIENYASVLTITASTLSGNAATNNGGAIDNDYGATLLINNSTFSSNSAGGGGGGLENYQASATFNNSTLSANFAGGGGGINNIGNLALTNTIVAGNTAPILPDLNLDSSGSFTGANNLTNGTPLLASLGNYGGPTQTMPPLFGSPAIDAGWDSVTNLLLTEQRGYPRRSGAHVDIGAAEAQWAPAGNAPLLTGPARASAGTFSFSFTNSPVADFTVLATTNIALPLGQWSILGAALQNLPGQYQFTDSAATNYPQRFYRVASP